MNIQQVLRGVKKDRCYSRPAFKENGRYTVKIVSVLCKPWIWSKTNISGVVAWDRLNDVEELDVEHRTATDWVQVRKPS